MFRIGEFSKLSQVSIKALRHYDDIGLLRPGRIDPENGYRYYSAAQLPKLNRVIALKGLGFPLEQVARMLDDGLTAEQMRGMLHLREAELRQRLEADGVRLTRVEFRLRQIEEENNVNANEVVVKEIPALRIASIRRIVPTYAHIGEVYEELCSFIGQKQLVFTGPPLALYYDKGYTEHDVDLEAAVPVAGDVPPHESIKMREIESDTAACTVHCGPYEGFMNAYGFLMKWIEENGYEITGPNREVYLAGPGQVKSPEEYVTEVQIPVRKKA